MATYYSGSVSDIQTVLRTLGVGSGSLDDLDTTDVQASQRDIDQRIDGALSNLYYVPISQVIRGGVTKFPPPLPELSRRLVASDLIINTLTDVSANITSTAEVMAKESKRDLFNLVNGVTGANRLDGQIKKTRNHFMPPNIAPAAEPMQMI